jgi:hypothetical protein
LSSTGTNAVRTLDRLVLGVSPAGVPAVRPASGFSCSVVGVLLAFSNFARSDLKAPELVESAAMVREKTRTRWVCFVQVGRGATQGDFFCQVQDKLTLRLVIEKTM